MASSASEPQPALGVVDTAALIVGIVVGVGIFKTPALVAGNTGSESAALLVWLAGGAISLAGALCYAELATAYPDAGGDYHYLTRAFGRNLSFLFAWARMMVIQTGSIALQAFVIGDYASELLRLGAFSPSVYAALVIALVTGLNVAGLRPGSRTQNLLAGMTALGVLLVAAAGLLFAPPPDPAAAASGDAPSGGALGLAMVFVLLTYGGWNEAAYVSAEMRNVRRNMVRALVLGIGVITLIYLLVNAAYLQGLGRAAMAGSEVVAADLMRRAVGETGARFISLLIVVAALSTINGTVITGARTNYALGRDFPLFGAMGRWQERPGAPRNALLAQGIIALALVLLGTLTRSRFTTMVEYTAPVFWFFLLMVGLSLFVLRRRDADAARPFRVPLYPLTPLLFCAVCLYMLYSSLVYTKIGALVGVAVVCAGAPLLLLGRPRHSEPMQQRTG